MKTHWTWEEWQAGRAARRAATDLVSRLPCRRRERSADKGLKAEIVKPGSADEIAQLAGMLGNAKTTDEAQKIWAEAVEPFYDTDEEAKRPDVGAGE